jgi:hypothetical protein
MRRAGEHDHQAFHLRQAAEHRATAAAASADLTALAAHAAASRQWQRDLEAAAEPLAEWERELLEQSA